MARKQIGLKFEEAELAAWDEWAAAHGLNRTTFLEIAARALMKRDLPTISDLPTVEVGRRLLDTYPALPREKLSRRHAVDARNGAMQSAGISPPRSGTFGKGAK